MAGIFGPFKQIAGFRATFCQKDMSFERTSAYPAIGKAEKPRWSLVPWGVVSEVVVCLEEGAAKYGAHDWQQQDPDLYFDALMRHLMAWRQGQQVDPESVRGTRHLVAVVCNAMFLAWFDGRKESGDAFGRTTATQARVG